MFRRLIMAMVMRIITQNCAEETIVTLACSLYIIKKKPLLTRVSFHKLSSHTLHIIAHCTLDFSAITQHN